MNLIFIRHGDPDYEHDTLTEKGWREAALLANRTSTWDIKEIYCSPLGRAQDTASLTLKKLNRTAITKDWLKEFDVPVKDPITQKNRLPWDFMPEYWTKEPLFYDSEHWYEAPVMKTGNIKQEYSKVCNGLDEILQKHGYTRNGRLYDVEKANTDTIVFFCHLGVTCTMLSHLLGVAAPLLWHGFYLAPTSVTMLTTEERELGKAFFRCKFLGDTTHLHDGNEPASKKGFFQETYK